MEEQYSKLWNGSLRQLWHFCKSHFDLLQQLDYSAQLCFVLLCPSQLKDLSAGEQWERGRLCLRASSCGQMQHSCMEELFLPRRVLSLCGWGKLRWQKHSPVLHLNLDSCQETSAAEGVCHASGSCSGWLGSRVVLPSLKELLQGVGWGTRGFTRQAITVRHHFQNSYVMEQPKSHWYVRVTKLLSNILLWTSWCFRNLWWNLNRK